MDRQKMKRIFAVVLMISCIFLISPKAFANNDPSKKDNGNFNFSSYDDPTNDSSADQIAQKTMGTAINVIRIVATGVSVVMLSYVGIKYMMAAPSEKAEFKKSATIFIVGAILIFAAGNILTIITNFTTNNIKLG